MWLGGVSEVAEVLGVSRQRLSTLRARSDFPDPVTEIAVGPIWDLDEIKAWGASDSRGTAGRPRAKIAARTLGGRFVLEEPHIGEGGYADVFRAFDRKHADPDPAPVAVKVLRQVEPANVRRLQRELRLLAKLDHPHVIRILGQGTTQSGGIWYAMPLAQGSLVQFAEEFEDGDKDNYAALLDVMRQVCAGLAFVHGEGIFHRDLKPGNILRFEDDKWVIADFGLAVEAERGTTALTATVQGFGTPWYTPEEQWGNAREANHLSDIFSLGRILQELVTGERGIEIPAGHLRPVILKATAKRPEDRYQSVDEFLANLERAIEAAAHGKTETAEETASRLLTRVRKTRAATTDLEELVTWALSLNEDAADDMKALTDVLPWLSSSSIGHIWTRMPAEFRRIFGYHSAYVARNRFEFPFCDVLADFARRAVNQTRDPQVLRDAVRSLTILGFNHTRWHVRDVLIAILQRVRNPEAVHAALEGLEGAGDMALAWNINDFSLRSMPLVLRAEIEKLSRTSLSD